MTLDEFKRSLSGAAPPRGVPTAVAALWWAAKDDWNRAHELVMDESGADAAWVHAYLHRIEGGLAQCRLLVPAGGPQACDRRARNRMGRNRGRLASRRVRQYRTANQKLRS
jgi:hypothetical protein